MARSRPARPCHPSALKSVRRGLELFARQRGQQTAGQVLTRLAERTPEFGAALAWLALRADEEHLREEALGLLLRAGHHDAPLFVVRRALEQARPIAREAFTDPTLPDAQKQGCLALLTLAGAEPSLEEAQEHFQDFAGSMRERLSRMAGELADTPASVEELLRSFELLEGHPTLEAFQRACLVLQQVGTTAPLVAATALVTAAAIGVEHALPPETVFVALEMAAEAHPGRTRWLVEELLRWPLPGYQQPVQDLRDELAEAAIEPLPPPLAPQFVQGLVTQVDGTGLRSLMVSFARGDGAHDALLFLLSDQLGLRQAYGVWEEGAAAEAHLRSEPALLPGPVDLARVRALLGAALALHHQADRPLPGAFLPLRALLGPEPLPCAPCPPQLGSYLLETFARGPALVEDSGALAGVTPFDLHGFDSPAAFACAASLPARRPRGRQARQAEVDRLLAAIEPAERALLLSRLAVNLDLLARRGEGRTATARAAAGVYLALSEGVVPWEQVPWLRALAETALVRLREGLAAGLRTREELLRAEVAAGIAEREQESW